MKHETAETLKQLGDGLSVITVIASLVEVLPAVASLFTIIWTGMRITEIVTGREFSDLIGWKKDDDAKPD